MSSYNLRHSTTECIGKKQVFSTSEEGDGGIFLVPPNLNYFVKIMALNCVKATYYFMLLDVYCDVILMEYLELLYYTELYLCF